MLWLDDGPKRFNPESALMFWLDDGPKRFNPEPALMFWLDDGPKRFNPEPALMFWLDDGPNHIDHHKLRKKLEENQMNSTEAMLSLAAEEE